MSLRVTSRLLLAAGIAAGLLLLAGAIVTAVLVASAPEVPTEEPAPPPRAAVHAGPPLPDHAVTRIGRPAFQAGSGQVFFVEGEEVVGAFGVDDTVHFFRVETGEEVGSFGVPGIARGSGDGVCRDGRAIALGVGPEGREVRVFEIAGGKVLFSVPAKDFRVSPDGTHLFVTSGNDGRLLDASSGAVVAAWSWPTGWSLIGLSTAGKRLLVGESRRSTIVDAATGRELRHVKASGFDEAIAATPDFEVLCCHSRALIKRQVALIDVEPGTASRRIRICRPGAPPSMLSLDRKWLATETEDSGVSIWDVASGVEAGRIRNLAGSVSRIALSPSGARLAVVDDGMLRVWDMATRRELTRPTPHPGVPGALAFLGGGASVAVTGRRGLRVFDVASGRLLREDLPPSGSSFEIVHDTGLLTRDDASFRLTNLETGEELRRGGKVESGSVLPADGSVVARSDYRTEGILVLDGATLRPIDKLGESRHKRQTGIALSADGRLLASFGAEPALRVYDIRAKRQALKLDGTPQQECHAAVFSRDGALVAVSLGPTVVLLETATGKERARLDAGADLGRPTPAFSRDGRRVAAATTDGGIRIWDTTTGRLLHTLASPRVASLALSPDGSLAASGYADSTILIWRLP